MHFGADATCQGKFGSASFYVGFTQKGQTSLIAQISMRAALQGERDSENKSATCTLREVGQRGSQAARYGVRAEYQAEENRLLDTMLKG